jgi:hypothetical protein
VTTCHFRVSVVWVDGIFIVVPFIRMCLIIVTDVGGGAVAGKDTTEDRMIVVPFLDR